MALSKPPGSRVGERWIGLIYAPRGAAGKFNDPPYCQHHGALFLEGHRDVMKIRAVEDRNVVYKFLNCSQTVMLLCYTVALLLTHVSSAGLQIMIIFIVD